MVAKTIHSQDYKKIAQKETIYAIEPSMSRFKRPKDSYIYEINIYTDKNTYMFSCDENTWVKVPKCKNISIGQWGSAFDYSDGHTFFKGYNGYR